MRNTQQNKKTSFSPELSVWTRLSLDIFKPILDEIRIRKCGWSMAFFQHVMSMPAQQLHLSGLSVSFSLGTQVAPRIVGGFGSCGNWLLSLFDVWLCVLGQIVDVNAARCGRRGDLRSKCYASSSIIIIICARIKYIYVFWEVSGLWLGWLWQVIGKYLASTFLCEC